MHSDLITKNPPAEPALPIYWLEQNQADVPEHDDWLSAPEAKRMGSLRLAKRRADWRLGRWTAKRGIAASLHMPSDSQTLANIEIRSAPSGAPEVLIGNEPATITISLSHRADVGICAVAMSDAALGFDLETVESRIPSFVADYFTDEEQTFIAQAPEADRNWLVTLFWSGKESVLKALREGLRLDTRSVSVTVADGLTIRGADTMETWFPFHARYNSTQILFKGWWQYNGDLLRTLVSIPAPALPICLKL